MLELFIAIAAILAGNAIIFHHAHKMGYKKGLREGRMGPPAGPLPPLHGHCRSKLEPEVQGHQPKTDKPLDPSKAIPPPGGTSAMTLERRKWVLAKRGDVHTIRYYDYKTKKMLKKLLLGRLKFHEELHALGETMVINYTPYEVVRIEIIDGVQEVHLNEIEMV